MKTTDLGDGRIIAKFVCNVDSMKFRFLNKTIEHQRFQYNPIYYNERKERLERKKKQYQKLNEDAVSDDERKEYFKDSLKENWSRSGFRQSQQRSSNIRVLLLVGLILALGYFIFNGVDEVDTVVKNLW